MRLLLLAVTLFCSAAQAMPIYGQGTWTATLQGRDLNGDLIADAYFDTDLNITWVLYHPEPGQGQSWVKSLAFAAGLDVYGVAGWRLPATFDIGNDGCNLSLTGGTDCGYRPDPSSSEIAHMFYGTLGNNGYPDSPYGLTNTGPFDELRGGGFYSGTEAVDDTRNAWFFGIGDGYQGYFGKENSLHAWAVHDGDIGGTPVNYQPLPPIPVPEPMTWVLLLGGLVVLKVSTRRHG